VTAVPAERRSDSLESRWRQALETAPEVYVALDGDGRIADWNRAASALFVVGRDDVLGSTMARFVADQHREQVQVDLQAAMLRPLDAQHEPVQLELRTHTGRSFAAEWLVWAVDRRAGTLAHCFIRDVTERRRSQQTAALLAAVVEGSKDAIITEGRDGRITSWNAAAERMYRWAAETAVGSPSYLIVPLDKVPEHAEMIARVFAGDPVRGVETERVSRGGARIPVEVRMSPVPDASGTWSPCRRWPVTSPSSGGWPRRSTARCCSCSPRCPRRRPLRRAAGGSSPMPPTSCVRRSPGSAAAPSCCCAARPESDRDRLLAVMVRETTRSAHLITALLRIARLDQGEPLPTGEVDVALLCRGRGREAVPARSRAGHLPRCLRRPCAGTAAGRAQLPRDPQQPR
jgi:PAS domain S-box-containing protein